MMPGLIVWLLMMGITNLAVPKEFPLYEHKFPEEIEEELQAGQLSNAQAAYYYTYIGETEKGLSLYDIPLDWRLGNWTPEDSLRFLSYQPANVFAYLKKRLARERIVIISEAHHKPQHRVFTQRLLPILQELGFHHLGIETLSPSTTEPHYLLDTALQDRGFPLHSPLTGFYTREPQMGNLVRSAIRHDFQLFAYERTHKGEERDLQQAKNIVQYLKAHPKAKIVIHCGWYHAIESAFPKRKTANYMAHHLKQLTGIDPFTIYQDALTERRYTPPSPYFTHTHAAEVSLLVNEKEVFAGFDSVRHVDAMLYHPPAQLRHGRPDWLWKGTPYQPVPISSADAPNPEQTYILEAIPKGESLHAVPLDRQVWSKGTDRVTLALPKGDYHLRWFSPDGNHTLRSLSVE
jgi:hypothetical protein